ncbi:MULTISPECIES: hypothetical protein [Nocardia]|uniref:hypothetical protein n=1 Tax=Nocardia TaxID=1817 RepID=UPI0015EFA1B1|nr:MULTISPECIES: hypothetical protein [Nocardia]MCA2208710.1 hypothetical protein [Nocardia rosealba]
MIAQVIALVPDGGFVVRRAGARWELINSRRYGPDQVLHSWPLDRHGEAFEHCHRLNGCPIATPHAAHH